MLLTNSGLMKKSKLIPLFIAISLIIISCEDDIFAPRNLEGTWNVTEYDYELNEMHFTVGIDYYPGDNSRILIGNFSNLGFEYEVVADISETDLTINYQEIDGGGGLFRISGRGTATSNLRKIDWEYSLDGDNYTALFEKE